MFDAIIRFSLENKLIVLIGVFAISIIGVFSASQIPLDAVPDITNNQVQIVSIAPTFAPEEVEQLITYPLESSMTNIPDVVEVRSISRYGLSVITIVFEEKVEVLRARQFVQEQLNVAAGELPSGVETELMPITTGLGEIYQYVLTVAPAYAHKYDATELRTIQDWIVKRQLNGTEGIIEVSSFGGYLKQYEVALDPVALRNYGVSVEEVITALEDNNENSGGSYLEQGSYSYYIRTEGRVGAEEDIMAIPLGNEAGPPLRIRDVARVTIGSAKRYGAMTMDGKGEVVGGITLMLKGANSSEALRNVRERMATVEASLPEGVSIYPYLDRASLIGKTIDTVRTNLIEGGLIVIFVLLLLLGNLRAGLVVASVIPLSMLFALIMMRYFGISANLMSLGAIDFGIVIDGAVIIVEGLLHALAIGYVGQHLSQAEMDAAVRKSTGEIYRSAAFGVLIILLVFLPILTLEGTEGKTFRPMAQVVSFAILGSLILSVTYVPVMASLFLSKNIKAETGFAARIMAWLEQHYRPVVRAAVRHAAPTLLIALVVLAAALFVFSRMGGEFIPTLEEGDIAMQQAIKPGSSLQESIHTSTMAEKILLDNFPEVKHVVSKIGTAEVPTDPMAIEDADIMIILKDKEEWTSADNREDLMAMMKDKLAPINWASFDFTQPIQLRFNELMTGAKSDIAVKIFGENAETLKESGDRAAAIIEGIEGAGDVRVDQTDGLQQLSVNYDRNRMAQYGVTVRAANQLIRAAYAGEIVGSVYEEERKFDLVVRLNDQSRQTLDLDQLSITARNGRLIPLSEVASVEERESPMLISREQARRFINIGVNVRNRDVATLVADIQTALEAKLDLPPGYEVQYGGQFESLQSARVRLLVAVPLALGLILLLLYLAFGTFRDALVIFVAVPLSAIGGILALELRGMPFSISSGIGFIALFGISVLNGIVLISAIKHLKPADYPDFSALITDAAATRLRPVLMTAAVAAFGFLPMALSNGSGAEVQRPLATVVIGGLLSSTLLTLVVLPALYYLVNRKRFGGAAAGAMGSVVIAMLLFSPGLSAQTINSFPELLDYALEHNPSLANQQLRVRAEALNRRSIGAWSPLEIDYQGGQINAVDFDHQLSVHQNLNHLFSRGPRGEVIDARVAELEAENLVLVRELAFRLRKSYLEWEHQNALLQLQDSLARHYVQLTDKIELRRRAGTLGVIDEELFRQELRNLRQQVVAGEQSVAAAEAELRLLALLPDSLHLRPRPPNLLVVPEEDTAENLYLTALDRQRDRLDKETALTNRLERQPQLSAGYFLQTIEKDFAFQGLAIGVGLPLDRRNQKVRSEQATLQRETLNNQSRMITDRYTTRLGSLRAQIAQLQPAIAAYKLANDASNARISQIARLQFEQGAIDFLTFSQLSQRGFDGRRQYLQQLHQLNQLVIELSYLQNQF
ncbi:CusA/CzcA family heavy metal efflux RND transporter [Neolewinella agarilytica]|uniref:Cobalt-zinc-cadmium resistance protein CzcA n=1 Tax=Neolewinella agarilytica TaxID=478744 RepID=A0A1H9JTF2_9BACT|nr:CusA/CzcA family heavy metal efflux RND transporter [Neolewinella agarilytica]SEQ90112.1 cobalt-zinc-cadmium resistance protein CzcA [Neolewinella agarilytica]